MTEDIKDLIADLTIPGETYHLQRIGYTPGQIDDWGDSHKEWIDIQQLEGIIQRDTANPEMTRGYDETAAYKGFFVPDFVIEHEKMGSYRIKNRIVTEDSFFTRYFLIKKINRNLGLSGHIVHYEMILELMRHE